LPVGTGTSGYVTYFSGTNTIAGAVNHFWDDTNSRLGINTSTPLSPLQVVIGAGSGTVARFGEASGTTGKQLLIGVDTATGRSEIQSVHQGTGATPLALNPSSGSVLIGTTTDSGYRLDVTTTFRNTTSAYFATSSGSVGIATTNPSNKLEVIVASSNSGVSTSGIAISDGAANRTVLFMGVNTANYSYIQSNQDNVSSRPLILNGSGGNVGIGCTPSNLLQTNQTGTSGYFYSGQQSGTEIAYWYYNASEVQFSSKAATRALTFLTSDVERMRITSGGNVLIGTTTDGGQKFQVSGTSYCSGNITSGGNLIAVGSLQVNIAAGGNYQFYVSGVGNPLQLYNSNVGNIGNFNYTTGVYTPTSDINKKTDFELSTIGLNAILGLKSTLYRMNVDEKDCKKHLGFIAQEVKEFIPQAYVDNGNFIGLDYQAITSVLVKAIQELSKQNEELSNRLIKLENK